LTSPFSNMHFRHLHAQQELKNQKIREQLLRTERELHGILQKKYDIMEYARRGERDRLRAEKTNVTGLGTAGFPGSTPTKSAASSHNPLGAPPQEVRHGRALLALADFFGFYVGTVQLAECA